jgi:hypothetical protein
MLRHYFIDRFDYDKYAFSYLKKIIYIFIILLAFFILLSSLSNHREAFNKPFLGLLFISIFSCVSTYYFAIKKAKAYCLCIGEETIKLNFDLQTIGFLGSIAAKRAERRYGTSLDQEIKWKNIDKVVYKKKHIKIYDYNYDFLNGNGKIIIPKYIVNFDKIEDCLLEIVPNKIIKK